MTTMEIDDRLHATDARLGVLRFVGQGEVSSLALIVQLRGQGFADREVDDAVNALFAEGVLVQGWGNAVRRHLAA
jgi:hypothetical protein